MATTPNTTLTATPVSKNSVKVGDLTLDMIMGDMGAACHGEGNCETTDIEKKSILWGKDSQKEWKVTLSPTGTYVSWIRNGLLDALGAAVKEVVKCESGTYTNKCFGSSAMGEFAQHDRDCFVAAELIVNAQLIAPAPRCQSPGLSTTSPRIRSCWAPRHRLL
jgi:hypothetical protein